MAHYGADAAVLAGWLVWAVGSATAGLRREARLYRATYTALFNLFRFRITLSRDENDFIN